MGYLASCAMFLMCELHLVQGAALPARDESIPVEICLLLATLDKGQIDAGFVSLSGGGESISQVFFLDMGGNAEFAL